MYILCIIQITQQFGRLGIPLTVIFPHPYCDPAHNNGYGLLSKKFWCPYDKQFNRCNNRTPCMLITASQRHTMCSLASHYAHQQQDPPCGKTGIILVNGPPSSPSHPRLGGGGEHSTRVSRRLSTRHQQCCLLIQSHKRWPSSLS
jgi:hypothetical protein